MRERGEKKKKKNIAPTQTPVKNSSSRTDNKFKEINIKLIAH